MIAAPYRIRLRSLEIRDFRGIQHLELDFEGPNGQALDLAVLAGTNGCGKTSVLEAILAFLGRGARNSQPISEGDVRFGAAEFQLRGEVDFAVPVPDGDSAAYVVRSSQPMDLGWASHGVRGPQAPTATASLAQLETEYYSAQRLPLLTDQLAQVAQITKGPRNEMLRLADLQNRLNSAYNRQLRSSARPSGAPVVVAPFVRMQRWWRHFNPTTDLDVIPRSNDPGSGDVVIVRDAGREVPLDITSLTMACALAPSRPDIPSMVTMDRLSSGQLGILAFAGPIIFRDQPPDIVLIDEPEQHLHVRWQREILGALRALSPATQYIIATHSEEILDSALSYERFLLGTDDDPRAALADSDARRAGDAE